LTRRIHGGEITEDSHPYYHLMVKRNDRCVSYHPFPGDRIFGKTKTSQPRYDFIQHEKERNLLIMSRTILSGRVVISIDPLAPEEIILSGIRQIRDAAQIACKAHINEMVEQLNKAHGMNDEINKGENKSIEMRFVCHPLKVEAYIEYLRKYDQVIAYCMANKIPLTVRDGVQVMKEKGFPYKVMFPHTDDDRKNDNLTKKWREATRRAFYLIRCAPNIPFAPLRTEKNQLE